jgi:hypothetical protein
MTLTITAVEEYSLESPTIALSVSSSPALSAPLRIYRHHPDGKRYRVMLDQFQTIVGTAVARDIHCPFVQPCTYTAEAGGQVSAASASVYLDSVQPWLIHPSDPALAIPLDKVGPYGDFTYAARMSESDVLGSALAAARVDYPLGGQESALTIICNGELEVRAVHAIRAAGGHLLLNDPHYEVGWLWIKPGALKVTNPVDNRNQPWRVLSFPYKQVRQPDVDYRLWTFDEAEAAFPTQTFTQMEAIWATFDDASLDIRLP